MMKSIVQILCWTLPLLLWDSIRLTCFVILLMPGFVRFAWYYFVTANRTSITYENQSCRQTLDVYSTHYTARQNDARPLLGAPVVVFFTGGAWLIGYKMWGALLARALTAAGMVVVIPDMRNYPWDSVPAMVEDVEQSVQWIFKNISIYGGDPEKVVLAGQSAGGHVVFTALLRMAMRLELKKKDDQRSTNAKTSDKVSQEKLWLPNSVKGFLSLSAPYNLDAMQKSFSSHGLDPEIIDRIFGNRRGEFDPYQLAIQCQRENRSLAEYLPPIRIFHGTLDKTAPYDGAVQFTKKLNMITGNDKVATLSLYQGWSHTDPILEGPMDADHRFHKDLFNAVTEWTNSRSQFKWPEDDPIIQNRLCPRLLIQAGRFCMPF